MQIREPFPIKGISQCFYVTSHDEEVLRVLVRSYELKIHICQINGMKLKQIGLLETNFYIDHIFCCFFAFPMFFVGFNQTWFQPNHEKKVANKHCRKHIHPEFETARYGESSDAYSSAWQEG